MLAATKDLISYLKKETTDIGVIKIYVHTILNRGTVADAHALVAHYLNAPENIDNYLFLLPVINKLGDKACAQLLFDALVINNKLKDEETPYFLETLGVFKLEQALPILKYYAFENNDYYCNRSAILGLLHFDCSEFEIQIISEIEKTFGKNLFNEFVPALVCKVKDKTEILEKLYDLGEQTASTDCNAGIVLGFSLCGAEGLPYFKKLIFNSNWEAHSGATGTIVFTYQGMQNLGITFQDLFEQIKTLETEAQRKYAFSVFIELLEMKLKDSDPLAHKNESFFQLYTSLFTKEAERLEVFAITFEFEDQLLHLRDLALQLSKAEMLLYYQL